MPVRINKRTFHNHAEAVRYVMRHKGLTKQEANAYVAEIERRQGSNPQPRRKRR